MTYGVAVACRDCGTRQILQTPLEHYSRYLGGRAPADAMPDTTPEQRHLIQNKTCATKCAPWKNTNH